MSNQLTRRDFLKLTASGALGLALSELGLHGEENPYFDKELVDLSIEIPEEIKTLDNQKDTLDVLPEFDIEVESQKYSIFPYKSNEERNLDNPLFRDWYEFAKDKIPNAHDVDPNVINISPFAGINIENVQALSALGWERNPQKLLERIIRNCPPCTRSDIYQDLIEKGELGIREKDLFLRLKEVCNIYDRIDALDLQYSLLLISEKEHPKKKEIENRQTELRQHKSTLIQEYYLNTWRELEARTSCRNLISEEECHPESSHHDPEFRMDIAPVHCNGWVMRIVDVLSQVTHRPEISPVGINENGNYYFKQDGSEIIAFNMIRDWFLNESVHNGWRDDTDLTYSETLSESKNRLIVCIGFVSENADNFPEDQDPTATLNHFYILRGLNLPNKEPVLVKAEINANVPNGEMFLPIEPSNDFPILGSGKFKVRKFSIPILH